MRQAAVIRERPLMIRAVFTSPLDSQPAPRNLPSVPHPIGIVRTPRSAALLVLPLLAACDAGPGASADAPLFTSLDSIASPAPMWAAEPNLAVSPDGEVFMSWLEQQPDSSFALKISRRVESLWTQPREVTRAHDLFVNWADFPSIVALGDNRLAAHWLQKSGEGTYSYDVRVAQSPDGGNTWSAGVIPHRDSTESEHGFAALWPEDDGSLSLAWLDGRKYVLAGAGGEKEMMLMHTTIGRDMLLGPEVPLDTRICDCCQTSVARTSDGPVIVYRDRSAEEVRDIYIVRRVGRNWTAPAAVHADAWTINACPVNGPAVDARERRVAVAWFTAAHDSARVKVAFSNDGGATFGVPVRVDDGNPAGRVDVVMLEDGAALVSWVENVGDRAEVRVRRVRQGGERGGAREPAVTIAQGTASRSSGFPRMAATKEALFFAWTVPGATRDDPSGIRVARAALSR